MSLPRKRTAVWDETKQDWTHADEEAEQAASGTLAASPSTESLAKPDSDASGMGNTPKGAFVGRKRTAQWSDEHQDWVHQKEEIPNNELTAPRPEKAAANDGKPPDPYGPFKHIDRQYSGLRGKKLLDETHSTLAKLLGLRETIHAQDKHLLSQAIETHDHHHDQANQIREDLADKAPGDEPVLEDAYGHHLLAKSQADDVMSGLAWRQKKHRPMVGEGSERPMYPYHPHAILAQQMNPDSQEQKDTKVPYDNESDPANLPDAEEAQPTAHDDVHDENDQQTAPPEGNS